MADLERMQLISCDLNCYSKSKFKIPVNEYNSSQSLLYDFDTRDSNSNTE